MPIKIILVPLADAEGAQALLGAALGLARDFEARLNVLHVKADPVRSLAGFMDETMSPALAEEVISEAEERSAKIAARTRKAFDEVAKKAKAGPKDVTYTEVMGNDAAVESRGRLADLIVVRRPRDAKDGTGRMVAEVVLMGTGRPVLVVPPKQPAKIGTNIAIAWNGSLEASKAVAAALPFLTRASKVAVISANDGDGKINQKDLLAYLAGHGVKAKAVTVKAGSDTGRAITNAAKRAGANLLVMGAYTHSRVREMIFGGVTQHALSSATLPVLLIH